MFRGTPFHAFATGLGLLALSGLTPLARAQQTWIVDANGGGNFTDLGPALSIAASGDEIVIRRGGSFSGFYSVSQKSLRIRSEGGRPMLTRGLSFTQVPSSASSPIVLSGLDSSYVAISDCGVMFAAEDCTIGSFGAVRSAGAALNRCLFGQLALIPALAGISFQQTPGTLSSCAIVAYPAFCNLAPPPTYSTPQHGATALHVVQSIVTLTDSTLQGGDGAVLSCGTGFPGAALTLSTFAEVHATRSRLSGGALNGVVDQGVMLSYSQLHLDPSTTLVGRIVGSNSTTTTRSIPAALGMSAAPGGTASYRLEGQANSLAALFASLKFTPPLAIDLGLLWPTSDLTLLLLGTTDANGGLGGTLAIPSLVPHGTVLVVQGFQASGGAPGLLLSTPVVLQAL